MPNAVGQYPSPQMDSVVSKPAVTTTVKTPDDIAVLPPAKKEEGSSSLMKALTGLAIVGSAAVLLYNLRKSKDMVKTVQDFKAQGGKFEKGIAKNADGSLFEGILIQRGAKNGNTYTRTYANGRLVNASKNFAEARNVKTDKIENYVKEYSYTKDNKLSSIKTKIYENGKVKTETTTTPTNMLALGEFKKVGDKNAVKIVDGKAVTKDGKKFDGVIAEKLGDDILISEYKDGEQISERLNMTLKDNKFEKGTEFYSLNKSDLQKREEEIFEKMLASEKVKVDEKAKQEKIGNLVEALRTKKEEDEMLELLELEEAIAKEEEAKRQAIVGIVEGLKEKKAQDTKTTSTIKNFFTSIFSSKKP